MTAVPLGTTPTLCVLCPPARPRVSRPGGFTDWECHDRLAEQLREVFDRFATLSAAPGGGQGQGRRAPGYGSKPPVNMNVAALRDPRTRPLELGEAHSPLNLFITWGRWLRQARGQNELDYGTAGDLEVLQTEGMYLLNALDWVTRQEWVPTFAGQLRVVVRQLRAATGEPNPRPCGWCTALFPDGSSCGHPLFPPSEGSEVRCGACSTAYDPLAQIRLKRSNIKAGFVAEGNPICRLCGHSDNQHDNDHIPRPCQAQWCQCPDYEPEDLT